MLSIDKINNLKLEEIMILLKSISGNLAFYKWAKNGSCIKFEVAEINESFGSSGWSFDGSHFIKIMTYSNNENHKCWVWSNSVGVEHREKFIEAYNNLDDLIGTLDISDYDYKVKRQINLDRLP